MATKLYVGNIPYTMRDENLKAVFEPYGQVSSARVIVDRQTRRSRGFGFVEMENEAEAQSAIQALNSSEVSGRNIVVSEAKPKD